MPDLLIPRLARLAVLAALLAATLLAVAPHAEAGTKPCAEEIVADWYGDGRVDKLYPLGCYRAAIRSLPVDVLDYSNAREDILRALQFARKGKPDPGPSGGPSPNGEEEDPTTPDDPPDDTGPPDTGPDGDTGVVDDGVDTSGPSSIPLPLFILGGLALLLLAAGAAGYVSRRAQGRRPGGPPAS